jgi:hypothetical protein
LPKARLSRKLLAVAEEIFFQTLKESILAEQEKMMLQLTEEKLSLSAEKSRLETSSKLVMNYDAQRAKTEIEAAVQIAREAAELTDKEREQLHREKCEVEKLKRTLLDQERKLSLRENELDNLMKDAERKIGQGEKAIFESKTMENKYNERLKDLQNQLVTLANRERKLAEEKIALSKERLALNTLARQSKKCSLCSADPQKLDENNFNISSVNLIAPYFSRYDNVSFASAICIINACFFYLLGRQRYYSSSVGSAGGIFAEHRRKCANVT